MPHYMAELVMAGRPVWVIGGGVVARRKIGGLLACGAVVTVIAPELDPGVVAWVVAERVRHWPERFSPALLARRPAPLLVFAATGDAALNREVARICGEEGLLCNSADDPGSSGFLVPAVVRRGRVTVAVGSGGTSPAVSRVLKERIDGWLEPGWGELAAAFGAWRQRVVGLIPEGEARQRFWRESALEAVRGEWRSREGWSRWLRARLGLGDEEGEPEPEDGASS